LIVKLDCQPTSGLKDYITRFCLFSGPSNAKGDFIAEYHSFSDILPYLWYNIIGSYVVEQGHLKKFEPGLKEELPY